MHTAWSGGSSTNGGSRCGRGGGGGSKKWWQQKKGGGGFQAPSGNPRPTGPWFCFSPGATSYNAPGFQQDDSQGSGGWRAGAPSLLGQPPQAHAAYVPAQAPTWDQAGLIAALNQMALQNGGWVVDSGASGHMSSTDGILLSRLPPSHSSITVGNGHTLPITCRGNSTLTTPTSHF